MGGFDFYEATGVNIKAVAEDVRSLDMFPFFDIANSIKAAMMVRASLGAKFVRFSAEHPMTCWFITMLSQSVGSMVSSVLLGKPAMGIFADPHRLSISTVTWFLIFYTDFYNLANFCPIAIVYSVMAEVHRANRVIRGVTAAARVYPASYIIMILTGTITGNGKDALRIISTTLNGLKSSDPTETIRMIPWTKLSLLAATLFTFTELYAANEDAFRGFFPDIHDPVIMLDLVFLTVVLIFEFFMLLNFMNLVFDPFAPLNYLIRRALAPNHQFDKQKLH